MKFILGILLIIGFGYLAISFNPFWWASIGIAAIVGAIIGLKPSNSFLYGFLGLFLLSGGYCAWLYMLNDGIGAERIGRLFGGISGVPVIIITAVLAGLLGGMSTMTGSLARKMF